MCGITGIISLKNEKISFEKIKEINDLIRHRGPDGEGFYIGENFAFGHRRLSIIDLSNDGNQPMILDDDFIIIYNGEVYNYVELREELRSLGVIFYTGSDTEVILKAYKEWGTDCVNRFNGMWSFSIFDKKKNILFCSRDRFGVKPFYYVKNSDFFSFGSEIKQLLPFNPSNKLNKRILADYLIYGFEEHNQETFFENIYKLEPSHNLIYNLSTHEIKIYSYYSLKDNVTKKLNITNHSEKFRDLLKNSIELRLRSDVKVGTCLSGGLDSSSIAMIASQIYGDNFIGINAKSIQKDNDESDFAKIVAKKSSIDLHFVEPNTDDFYKVMKEVIKVQEEPFGGPSIFMQYFVFEKAKALGCKVMLDGQGGDELLLGYERYFPAYWLKLPLLSKMKEIVNFARNSRLSVKEVVAYLLYFTSYKLRDKLTKRKWSILNEDFVSLVNKDLIKKSARSYRNSAELQILEYKHLQLPHLLKYEDKNSMYHSIEARLPFLDYRLVQYGVSLPIRYKLKNGWTKFILRDSMKDILPEEIGWRKEKFGFEAPTKIWMEDKKMIIDEIKNSKILRSIISDFDKLSGLTDHQLWKLLNISLWEKIYKIEV